MTHNVETMAWSGQVPWHGLGVRVEADITCADMLERAGLNWSVSKRRLFTGTKGADIDGVHIANEVPDRFALVRDSDEAVLDIVGKRYVPVQNADSMGFFADFVKAGGMELHTAGSLCGGQYVWVLAKIKQQQLKIMRTDELESYLLLLSPHKLGLPLVAQHTAVRVVCWNTLNAALGSSLKGSGKHTFRMPHVHKFDAAMQERAKEALGYATEQFKQFGEAATLLAKTPISSEAQTDYFKRVFRLDDASLKARGEEDVERASRVIKQLELAAATSPGADLKSAEGTLWGAFNAVTFQVDHMAGRSRDKTVRDIWLGYRGETKRRALAEALALAA